MQGQNDLKNVTKDNVKGTFEFVQFRSKYKVVQLEKLKENEIVHKFMKLILNYNFSQISEKFHSTKKELTNNYLTILISIYLHK